MRRRSWRPFNLRSGRAQLIRFVRFGLATLGIALLIGVYIKTVLGPLTHPRTHIGVLLGNEYDPLELPPIPYMRQAAVALEGLSPSLHNLDSKETTTKVHHFDNLRTAAAMWSLSKRLEKLATGSEDVLLLTTSVYCFVEDGIPLLACGDYEKFGTSGRFPCKDMLAQIGDAPLRHKVLFLEWNQNLQDVWSGHMTDGFPILLEELVHSTRDPNLWVLISHGYGESSQVSQGLNRSLFSFFVASALHGLADMNSDQNVSLDELHKYVSFQIGHWVKSTSGQNVSQTPKLIWGGGSDLDAAESPILISIEGLPSVTESQLLAASLQNSRKNTQPIVLAQAASKVTGQSESIVSLHQEVDSSSASRGEEETIDASGGDASEEDQSKERRDDQAANQVANEKSSDDVELDGLSVQSKTNADGENSNNSDASTQSDDDSDASSAAREIDLAALAAQLLIEGWQLYGQLEHSDLSIPSPLGFAPRRWRAFGDSLLAFERQLCRGGSTDTRRTVSGLRKLLPPWRALALGQLENGKQYSGAWSQPALSVSDFKPFTIGMAELLQQYGARSLSPAETLAIAKFDRSLTSDDSQQLRECLANLPAGFVQLSEMRLAKQLLTKGSLPWPVVKQALATRRQGERVATKALGLTSSIGPFVVHADHARLNAERILLDNVSPTRDRDALEWLARSNAWYTRADKLSRTIQRAESVLQRELFNLPEYLRWTELAGANVGARAPQLHDLEDLVDQLGQLREFLVSTNFDLSQEIKWEKLERSTEAVERIRGRLRVGTKPQFLERLTGATPVGTESWRLSLALSTTLLPVESRFILLQYQGDVDSDSAKRYQFPVMHPNSFSPNASTLGVDYWQRQVRLARIRLSVVELACQEIPLWKEERESLSSRLSTLENELKRYDSGEQSSVESLQASRQEIDRLVSELLQNLVADSNSLPPSQQDFNRIDDRGNARSVINQCLRLQLIAPVRYENNSIETMGVPLRLNARWFDLLVWYASRFETAMADANKEELKYYDQAVEAYRQAASSISYQPELLPRRHKKIVDLTGPDTISLEENEQAPIEIPIELIASASGDSESASIQVLLDYNPELLEVEALGSEEVYHLPERRPSNNDLEESIKSDTSTGGVRLKLLDGSRRAYELAEKDNFLVSKSYVSELPATAKIGLRQPHMLRLAVRRRAHAYGATRLIVKVILNNRCERHESEVILPPRLPLELLLEGKKDSWSRDDRGIALHTFANRNTPYFFRVQNKLDRDAHYHIALYKAKQPVYPLEISRSLRATDLKEFLKKFAFNKPISEIENLVVPVGEETMAVPFPDYAAEDSRGEVEQDRNSFEASYPSGNGIENPFQIFSGMIFVATDSVTGDSLIIPIRVVPQRPRRLLKPTVRYLANRKRISVRVDALAPPELPDEAMQISLSAVVDLPGRQLPIRGRLFGELQSPEYSADLFLDASQYDGRPVWVMVDVDGYPRAFQYLVMCDPANTQEIDEQDPLAVRIIEPLPNSVIEREGGSVSVVLQVDAPRGAFENSTDMLEVGMDPDRDREIANDDRIQLRQDRQVGVAVSQLTSEGMIEVYTRVNDFLINLPTRGIRSGRLGIVARLLVGGQEAWSVPHEVILDTLSPDVTNIAIQPQPFVGVGETLRIGVRVDDHDHSGVEKVVVGVDTTGMGEFGEKVTPIHAALDATGVWLAEFSTEKLQPGVVAVLVQATDRAGNACEIQQRFVQVISTTDAEAMKAEEVGKFSGTVFYGKTTANGIVLSLQSEDGTTVDSVESDPNGHFAFRGVRVGSYTLFAEGVVRNKTRRAETQILVQPLPSRTKPVELHLK